VLTRLRNQFQRARRLNADLERQGASRAERWSLLAQKARRAMMPPGTRRDRAWVVVGRPLFRPLLHWAHRHRHGNEMLVARRSEFAPVSGALEEQEELHFPETATPRCSVLVPVYGKWRHTYTCLRSILRAATEVPYEVLVLDDASPDETPRLAEKVHGVRYVRHPENLGFLRNCNAGAAHARGETLLFLNNDTLVQDGWLDALHDALDADPEVGLVGAKLVGADGRLQEAGGIVFQDGSGWNYGRGDDPHAPAYDYRKEVDYCSGACLLVPRALWQDLGGFDDRFAPCYYEDTDLAFAVRAAGRKVVYEPRAVVVHLEGVSHGTDTSSGFKRYQEVNRVKFVDKWGETLRREQAVGPDELFAARDRSRGRPRIAVVDHQVPSWDADAGSRHTWQWLELFVREGWQVHFLPDNLFPAQPYTTQLQAMGVEVLHGHGFGPHHAEWWREHGAALDAVHLHRPQVAAHHLDAILEHAPQARLVYQCHDLHHVREQRAWELAGHDGDSPEALRWKALEDRAFAAADVVHTPSSWERDWLRQHRPGVEAHDVPLFFYDSVPVGGGADDPLAGRDPATLLFVGGFRHPPNEDGVRWFVAEVWPLVRARRPDARLVLVGAHVDEALAGDGVEVRGRVSEEELAAAYASCRAVVVPLRYGAGVKGKVVEAMAAGLPVVTTPVGAEGIPGADAALAPCADAAAFAARALEVIEDDAAWRAAREAGLALVRDAFSVERARAIIRRDFAPTRPDGGEGNEARERREPQATRTVS